MKKTSIISWMGGLGAATALTLNATPARISVAADQPGHAIPPTLWGIFFEDINLSADGGIYPELVRNRSFEDGANPDYWTLLNTLGGNSTMAVTDAKPLNPFNRHSLQIKVNGAFTLENAGYWGMNFVQGESYNVRFAAEAADGFSDKVTVKLLSSTGAELASGDASDIRDHWSYHTLELTPASSDPKGRLQISSSGHGTLLLDMVSVLPKKTWKDHGLRPDLAESINELHPSFMRFPGGCWVEGDDFAHMNHWKNTIGDIDTRIPLWNLWNYYGTQGLGLYEYLQLVEDLKAAPLFCINIGMSHHETVPMDKMDQWVQDALDVIEYANGPTNTVWGAHRAASGHPEPFNLQYMEIGNENGGFPGYVDHWQLFYKAIKDKYPDLKLVADGWDDFGDMQPDIVDDHYYDTPEWFMRNSTLYDKHDRNGPKVFVGEYAVTRDCGLGNLRGALGEAAFMTGLERNSDVVVMASYAPLFVNLNHRAWNPDLINFDSSCWYGLPSYFVQQMFSENRGDTTLPTVVSSPMIQPAPKGGKIGVGAWLTQSEYKDVKATAPDGTVLFASDSADPKKGWDFHGGSWDADGDALRQNASGEFLRALAGEDSWVDYTINLKARKLGGNEGFLILFHINGAEDRTWWNIGGWGNTRDAVEYGSTLDSKPGVVETGRWYDVKVEVTAGHVKCYLDGQLIHDLDLDATKQLDSIYANASRDEKTGDVILKVVNVNTNALETEIDLTGAKNLTGAGTAVVLTSENGADENDIDHPAKVSPKTADVNFTGNNLTRTFPGNSFTILRLKTGS